MKRTFKAFTLVELLVVIVIFGILMSGLMNFWQPIRQTYVDATLYEQQRTTQDGIAKYLCEQTRYADNKMVIVDEGAKAPGVTLGNTTLETVNNVGAAMNVFWTELGITAANQNEHQKEMYNTRVIVINRKQNYDVLGNYISSPSDKNKLYSGRLITSIPNTSEEIKNAIKSIPGDQATIAFKDDQPGNGLRAQGTSDAKTYMALGGAYYGAANFQIGIDTSSSSGFVDQAKGDGSHLFLYHIDETEIKNGARGGLTFVIRSSLQNTGNVVKNGSKIEKGTNTINVDGDAVTCITTQGNLCRNLADIFYYTNNPDGGHGCPSPTTANSIYGDTSHPDANTYIIYMLPDDKR